MRTIAVSSQKGGVGKTTTTVALAGLLTQLGHKVLLIDLDPQYSLTNYFRLDKLAQTATLYQVFVEPRLIERNALNSLICSTRFPDLHVLPGSPALATIERRTTDNKGLGLVVKKMTKALQQDYDYIFIDCPPATGILMVNALAACQFLLMPVQTEFLALKGLERIIQTINLMQNSGSFPIEYLVVPTMFDRRTKAAQSVLQTLRQTYGTQVCSHPIPIDTKLREASAAGMPPSLYHKHSQGVVSYQFLLEELQALIARAESIKTLGAKKLKAQDSCI